MLGMGVAVVFFAIEASNGGDQCRLSKRWVKMKFGCNFLDLEWFFNLKERNSVLFFFILFARVCANYGALLGDLLPLYENGVMNVIGGCQKICHFLNKRYKPKSELILL